jgi:hydrogenase maturation protease
VTKTLVLGLGNPLLRDDSIGLRVIQALRPHLANRPDVDLAEDYWGGLRLMERMIGYERAIIVDAIQSQQPPGTVHLLSVGGVPTQRSASAHDVNLRTALQVGRQAGAQLPEDEDILLIGVEAGDVQTFCEQLSPPVEQAIPRAIDAVLTALNVPGEAA